MYSTPPPISLISSRRATIALARSATPDAPVVEERPSRRSGRRTARTLVAPLDAPRRLGARSLHRLADLLAPAEREALVR
ncbi:hypothetical protein [Cellulomonas composti]|uniref:Uncharacterized protein n=1 Tax=Cellulomonas composti TaxID=266130 RepID=A0A511JEI0_9CELL|nr:hypothetical protein [Cellulomonas composti]GEL96375.1 hypothetical protein CCO02nite_30330 [Cellulomonas composti]